MNQTEENLAAARELLLQIEDWVLLADDHQWSKPPTFRDDDEDKRRASGTVSDPTGETATNEARLQLRQAVIDTESDSFALRQALYRMQARLARALGPYRS